MRHLRLVDTCTQYTVNRNRYGDLVLSAGQTINCLYRDISQLQRGVNYREEQNIVGLFWFDPTATIKMGDVVKYNGLLYRIDGVVNAKDLLRNNVLQFIKCTVSLYRAIS